MELVDDATDSEDSDYAPDEDMDVVDDALAPPRITRTRATILPYHHEELPEDAEDDDMSEAEYAHSPRTPSAIISTRLTRSQTRTSPAASSVPAPRTTPAADRDEVTSAPGAAPARRRSTRATT